MRHAPAVAARPRCGRSAGVRTARPGARRRPPRGRRSRIKHDDIRGFMPGMTMPFKVRDATLLDGRSPGDLDPRDARRRGIDAAISRPSSGRARAAADRGPPPAPPATSSSPGTRFPTSRSSTRRASRARSRLARTCARRHVHLHALPASRLLPADGPPVRRRAAASCRKTPRLRGRVHLLSISFDPAFDTPSGPGGARQESGGEP